MKKAPFLLVLNAQIQSANRSEKHRKRIVSDVLSVYKSMQRERERHLHVIAPIRQYAKRMGAAVVLRPNASASSGQAKL